MIREPERDARTGEPLTTAAAGDDAVDMFTGRQTGPTEGAVHLPRGVATFEHAADGRQYNERDYIDRTISTIRTHNPDHLRENWWTGAALALADEVDRLRGKETGGDDQD